MLTPTAESTFDTAVASTFDTMAVSTFWIQFIATRVAIVTVFIACSVIGNGLVVHFNRKEKKQSGRRYIIALALVDLWTCFSVLPLTPFNEVAMFYQRFISSSKRFEQRPFCRTCAFKSQCWSITFWRCSTHSNDEGFVTRSLLSLDPSSFCLLALST